MARPGQRLHDARVALDITLDDAERDTRIARRYLDALERDDLDELPAAPYARGFARSYARYLKLDPEAVVHALFGDGAVPPAASPWASPAGEPAGHAPNPVAALIVLGVVALIFVAGISVGIAALRDGGGSGSAALVPGASDGGGRSLPITAPESDTEPRTVDAPTAVPNSGEMPDFRDRDITSALPVLDEIGVPYVIVDTYSDRVEPGRVLQQTPAPGASIGERTSITLVVSRGPAPSTPQP